MRHGHSKSYTWLKNCYPCKFNDLKPIQFSVLPRRTQHREGGFTLIEIMIVVAIIAILASIALPSYQRYILKSRAKSATADLVALSLTLENRFQKTLGYPVYGTSTLIAASPADRTGTVATNFGAWAPSQGKWFTYSIVSTADTYTVSAAGMGNMLCTLSLDNKNVRTASGQSCGFSEW
ncbi:N/A [soil metagenome]